MQLLIVNYISGIPNQSALLASKNTTFNRISTNLWNACELMKQCVLYLNLKKWNTFQAVFGVNIINAQHTKPYIHNELVCVCVCVCVRLLAGTSVNHASNIYSSVDFNSVFHRMHMSLGSFSHNKCPSVCLSVLV